MITEARCAHHRVCGRRLFPSLQRCRILSLSRNSGVLFCRIGKDRKPPITAGDVGGRLAVPFVRAVGARVGRALPLQGAARCGVAADGRAPGWVVGGADLHSKVCGSSFQRADKPRTFERAGPRYSLHLFPRDSFLMPPRPGHQDILDVFPESLVLTEVDDRSPPAALLVGDELNSGKGPLTRPAAADDTAAAAHPLPRGEGCSSR